MLHVNRPAKTATNTTLRMTAGRGPLFSGSSSSGGGRGHLSEELEVIVPSGRDRHATLSFGRKVGLVAVAPVVLAKGHAPDADALARLAALLPLLLT
jgi:hypothetical protein